MSSKVCTDPKYSKGCDLITDIENDNFCKCIPNFCENGILQNYTVPDHDTLADLSYGKYEDYKQFLVPLEKLIMSCTSDFKEFADVNQLCTNLLSQNIRCPREDASNIYACYTLHTLIERPNLEPEEVSTQATETLILDSVSDEKSLKVKEIELQLSIHHEKNILNPYVYGHSIKKGHSNLFRLTKTVKRLLPPPYETNCKDYLAEWEIRGGRGPTDEKECIEECQRNSSLEIRGCIVQMLRGPTNERVCRGVTSDERVLQAAHECAVEKCRPACYEVTYEVTKDVANFDIVDNCYDVFSDLYPKIVNVVIKLDGMQTTTYIYSPKYQNIETFSYVGGYVGMWLGISLVAVFDFLETMVVILRYPCRQIMQHRAKKQRIEHIRKLQRNV